jgi:hypothetical protein
MRQYVRRHGIAATHLVAAVDSRTLFGVKCRCEASSRTCSRRQSPNLPRSGPLSGWGFCFQTARLKPPLTAAAYRHARDTGTGNFNRVSLCRGPGVRDGWLPRCAGAFHLLPLHSPRPPTYHFAEACGILPDGEPARLRAPQLSNRHCGALLFGRRATHAGASVFMQSLPGLQGAGAGSAPLP